MDRKRNIQVAEVLISATGKAEIPGYYSGYHRLEDELKKLYAQLLKAAEKVRGNAYCPYSNFRVGAAALAGSKKIYTGANVENASYGLSCCAERVAIFKAIAGGERKILAVAVAGPGKTPAAPCGACRQVIHEFGNNAKIIMPGKGAKKISTIKKLLPEAFGKDNLRKK